MFGDINKILLQNFSIGIFLLEQLSLSVKDISHKSHNMLLFCQANTAHLYYSTLDYIVYPKEIAVEDN